MTTLRNATSKPVTLTLPFLQAKLRRVESRLKAMATTTQDTVQHLGLARERAMLVSTQRTLAQAIADRLGLRLVA